MPSFVKITLFLIAWILASFLLDKYTVPSPLGGQSIIFFLLAMPGTAVAAYAAYITEKIESSVPPSFSRKISAHKILDGLSQHLFTNLLYTISNADIDTYLLILKEEVDMAIDIAEECPEIRLDMFSKCICIRWEAYRYSAELKCFPQDSLLNKDAIRFDLVVNEGNKEARVVHCTPSTAGWLFGYLHPLLRHIHKT